MTAKKKETLNHINVNLLYPQGVTQKIYVKFTKWLIAYGRFIVVIVEVVVLVCFAMRFKLDNDLAYLKEEINNQIPTLESLEETEIQASQTQLRLGFIKSTFANSKLNAQTVSKVASNTPITTKISNLNLSEDPSQALRIQFKITAQTTNNNDISTFLSGLKEDKTFDEVTLGSIGFDQGVLIYTILGKSQ